VSELGERLGTIDPFSRTRVHNHDVSNLSLFSVLGHTSNWEARFFSNFIDMHGLWLGHKLHLEPKMKKKSQESILCKEGSLHPNLDHGTFEMVGGSILHDLMLNFNHKFFYCDPIKNLISSFENYGKKLYVFSLCSR
jgi:hypothetical protein